MTGNGIPENCGNCRHIKPVTGGFICTKMEPDGISVTNVVGRNDTPLDCPFGFFK